MKDVHKLSTLVLWASMIVTAVIFGIFYYRIGHEQPANVGSVLFWLYIILGVCVLAVVCFTIVQMVQRWRSNRRSLVPSLIWLVSAIVVLGVSYFWSKSNATEGEDAWMLMADMSLYSLYILLGLTIVAVFAGIIWSYIKRTR